MQRQGGNGIRLPGSSPQNTGNWSRVSKKASNSIARKVISCNSEKGTYAHEWASYLRPPNSGQLQLRELSAYNVRAFGLVADVTHQEEMERFLAASVDALGDIDSVVNNVGGSKPTGCAKSPEKTSSWRSLLPFNSGPYPRER